MLPVTTHAAPIRATDWDRVAIYYMAVVTVLLVATFAAMSGAPGGVEQSAEHGPHGPDRLERVSSS